MRPGTVGKKKGAAAGAAGGAAGLFLLYKHKQSIHRSIHSTNNDSSSILIIYMINLFCVRTVIGPAHF